MKTKYLVLMLFFSFCAYSQTMTEKYNSILSRYEYFDGQGNLTGYKVYDSLFKEWKYYQVEVQSYERKPIQYAKSPTDDNFALLQQVANQKQNSYNSNHKRIEDYLSKIQINIYEIENLEIRAKTQKRYDSEIVDVINNKGYDLSSNALTQQVLDFIYNKSNAIKVEEFKKYNDEIETRNIISESEQNTLVRQSVLPTIFMKFKGLHKVYRIEDYTRLADGRWTVTKVDNAIAFLTLEDNDILWERSESPVVTGRTFSFLESYSPNGYYIFATIKGGDVHIEKDFKKVIFYDESDKTKKYIYYIQK
jgi:hypothetical protein